MTEDERREAAEKRVEEEKLRLAREETERQEKIMAGKRRKYLVEIHKFDARYRKRVGCARDAREAGERAAKQLEKTTVTSGAYTRIFT